MLDFWGVWFLIYSFKRMIEIGASPVMVEALGGFPRIGLQTNNKHEIGPYARFNAGNTSSIHGPFSMLLMYVNIPET